jgi:hypothetical protein
VRVLFGLVLSTTAIVVGGLALNLILGKMFPDKEEPQDD